jgi:NhaP-type Na+/H+ or K+/H+ antiporter
MVLLSESQVTIIFELIIGAIAAIALGEYLGYKKRRTIQHLSAETKYTRYVGELSKGAAGARMD